MIKSNVLSNPDFLNGSALLLYLSRLIRILALRTNFQAKLRKLFNTVNQPLSTKNQIYAKNNSPIEENALTVAKTLMTDRAIGWIFMIGILNTWKVQIVRAHVVSGVSSTTIKTGERRATSYVAGNLESLRILWSQVTRSLDHFFHGTKKCEHVTFHEK